MKLLLLYKKHALNKTPFFNWFTEFLTSVCLREIQDYYMFCPATSYDKIVSKSAHLSELSIKIIFD